MPRYTLPLYGHVRLCTPERDPCVGGCARSVQRYMLAWMPALPTICQPSCCQAIRHACVGAEVPAGPAQSPPYCCPASQTEGVFLGVSWEADCYFHTCKETLSGAFYSTAGLSVGETCKVRSSINTSACMSPCRHNLRGASTPQKAVHMPPTISTVQARTSAWQKVRHHKTTTSIAYRAVHCFCIRQVLLPKGNPHSQSATRPPASGLSIASEH